VKGSGWHFVFLTSTQRSYNLLGSAGNREMAEVSSMEYVHGGPSVTAGRNYEDLVSHLA
jgi:hypothetical protein